MRGVVLPGPELEIEHLDAVVNAIDDSLVAIRTLDLEVFNGSDPQRYQAVRASLPGGSVVRALTAPRNNAVHHIEVVDPDLARAIGPLGDGTCIVFPRWKPSAALPPTMFTHAHGPKKGQPDLKSRARYDADIAGRVVLDTLLDAFDFFDRCDRRLADRDSQGKLRGFPLPPLPVGSYERLAPDWPDHDTVARRLRDKARAEPPAGTGRTIRGRLDTDDGVVFCGYTQVDAGRGVAFTEDVGQVVADIERGYPYSAVVADETERVEATQGELVVGSARLLNLRLVDWTGHNDEPWLGWWTLCTTDANWYVSQRRAT